MVVDIKRLMEEIDTFLSHSASRDLFSTVEVQDMLLDLRKMLQSDVSQN